MLFMLELILSAILGNGYWYHSHFTDEKPRPREAMCFAYGNEENKLQSWESKPGQSGSRVSPITGTSSCWLDRL
jgi:hypothetical protein